MERKLRTLKLNHNTVKGSGARALALPCPSLIVAHALFVKLSATQVHLELRTSGRAAECAEWQSML